MNQKSLKFSLVDTFVDWTGKILQIQDNNYEYIGELHGEEFEKFKEEVKRRGYSQTDLIPIIMDEFV